jgi:hypothetical protein
MHKSGTPETTAPQEHEVELTTSAEGTWLTMAEVQQQLRCSQRTIYRMTGTGQLHKTLQRIRGRKPLPLFNSKEVNALRKSMPMSADWREKLSTPAETHATQRCRCHFCLPLFLPISEASAYSGLSESFLKGLVETNAISWALDGEIKLSRIALMKAALRCSFTFGGEAGEKACISAP